MRPEGPHVGQTMGKVPARQLVMDDGASSEAIALVTQQWPPRHQAQISCPRTKGERYAVQQGIRKTVASHMTAIDQRIAVGQSRYASLNEACNMRYPVVV